MTARPDLALRAQRIPAVIADAASVFDVPIAVIYARGKTHTASRARQAAMWVIWEAFGYTQSMIARHFGRAHNTVYFGIQQAALRRHSSIADREATDWMLARARQRELARLSSFQEILP